MGRRRRRWKKHRPLRHTPPHAQGPNIPFGPRSLTPIYIYIYIYVHDVGSEQQSGTCTSIVCFHMFTPIRLNAAATHTKISHTGHWTDLNAGPSHAEKNEEQIAAACISLSLSIHIYIYTWTTISTMCYANTSYTHTCM